MSSGETLNWSLLENPLAAHGQRTRELDVGQGIFAKERCWRLHTRLTEAAFDLCTRLWQCARQGSRETARRLELFGMGLSMVPEWSQREMVAEARRLTERHADVVDDYRYTLLEYVRLLYDDASEELEIIVNRPGFEEFLRAFYRYLSTQTSVRSTEFFRGKEPVSGSEQRSLVAAAIRAALADCGVAEVRSRAPVEPAQPVDTTKVAAGSKMHGTQQQSTLRSAASVTSKDRVEKTKSVHPETIQDDVTKKESPPKNSKPRDTSTKHSERTNEAKNRRVESNDESSEEKTRENAERGETLKRFVPTSSRHNEERKKKKGSQQVSTRVMHRHAAESIPDKVGDVVATRTRTSNRSTRQTAEASNEILVQSEPKGKGK